MLRVKVREIRDGLHPNEVVVGFDSPEAPRKAWLSIGALYGGYYQRWVPGGSDQSNGRLLVELPRETTRGQWRVWVSSDSVVKDEAA